MECHSKIKMNTCSAHGDRVWCIVRLPSAQCFTKPVHSKSACHKFRLKSAATSPLEALFRPICAQCTYGTEISLDQSNRSRVTRRHVAASAGADAQSQSSEGARYVAWNICSPLYGGLIPLAAFILALCNRGPAWHVLQVAYLLSTGNGRRGCRSHGRGLEDVRTRLLSRS